MLTSPNIDFEGKPLARADLPVGDLHSTYLGDALAAIRDCAYFVPLELGKRRNSRENNHVGEWLTSVVAKGEDLTARLDWLLDYYQTQLRDIASEAMGEEAICLSSLNEIVTGNVFGPGMRLEAHTDIWAINANIGLKAAQLPSSNKPELSGGTVIGRQTASSHNEILANRMGIVPFGLGTVSVLRGRHFPHTVGLPDLPANYEVPLINDGFWEYPQTRISLNFSYTTTSQLAVEPHLASQSEEVGFSKAVLGLG